MDEGLEGTRSKRRGGRKDNGRRGGRKRKGEVSGRSFKATVEEDEGL
jgi:hypothetical protein